MCFNFIKRMVMQSPKFCFFVCVCMDILDSFRKTKETFGQINIVCNNAGIGQKNELALWEKVVDVNLVGKITIIPFFI